MAGLFPDSWREVLKGRIVLIGANMTGSDQHTTPLSVIEGRIPGVIVQAQALAQRLDGNRDIHVWPWWLTFLAITPVTLACFFAARFVGFNPQGAGYGLLGLFPVGLASLLAYAILHIDFPSIALATAWLGGGFGGFISRWHFLRRGAKT